MQLYNGDALEIVKTLPDASVDLVLTDPPYNIGKGAWDKIDNYVEWCGEWIKESARVLKGNGTLIFWHNDPIQAAELLHYIGKHTALEYNSYGLWHKPTFRARSWKRVKKTNTLRSWFNVTEFFFVFTNGDPENPNRTGLYRINSNPNCYKSLKEWYKRELERLGITEDDVKRKYTEATGKKPFMLRHYFKDSQFEIPTREIWESVYKPLGFLRDYEDIKAEYDNLRREYEDLRPPFNIQTGQNYCNYFTAKKENYSTGSPHPCSKPLNILERLIETHTNPGAVVLDLFMGGGSTGVAAAETSRDFIGIELDEEYFRRAEKRIQDAYAQYRLH